MTVDSERTDQRPRWAEIFEPWAIIDYIGFGLVVLKVSLSLFSALVIKWHVTQKWLLERRNRVMFVTQGY